MRLVPAFLVLLTLFATAGCVEENDTPTAVTPAGQEAEPDAPLGEVPDPVAWPIDIDGVSPSGVWICATGAPDCIVHSNDDADDVHEIPHETTVVGVTLTVTYTPVTPEVRGMLMRLNVQRDGQWMRLAATQGPSGTTLEVGDLNVTANETLNIVAYTMADTDAGGYTWVEARPQEYRIEGEVRTLAVPASD